MRNKETLKKQIIYRSTHRGSKEMDILLGNFVKRNIDEFNEADLTDLQNLLLLEDEVLHNLYFKKIKNSKVPNNKVTLKFTEFKI